MRLKSRDCERECQSATTHEAKGGDIGGYRILLSAATQSRLKLAGLSDTQSGCSPFHTSIRSRQLAPTPSRAEKAASARCLSLSLLVVRERSCRRARP
jgi:hypothetical protein